jgi:hypothetical protein
MARLLNKIADNTMVVASKPDEKAFQQDKFIRNNYEDGDRFLMRREGRG